MAEGVLQRTGKLFQFYYRVFHLIHREYRPKTTRSLHSILIGVLNECLVSLDILFKGPLMICEHNESTMIRIDETVTSICNVIKR